MRKAKIEVYTLPELKKVNEKAYEQAIYDLGIQELSFDWWDSTYDDAKQIGLKITEFDAYHHTIDGELTEGANVVANLILADHGKDCDTYKLAAQWFKDKHHKHNNMGDPAEQFKLDLLQCYLVMLTNEAEYLESEEKILEIAELNEWEFTDSGRMF